MSARMEITPMTTEQLARLSINLAGGNPNLDHIARIYRSNAATMRDIAAKAKAHPKGKSRGYTEQMALESARRLEENAVLVPAEVARQLGLTKENGSAH